MNMHEVGIETFDTLRPTKF